MGETPVWFPDLDEDMPDKSLYPWAAFVQLSGGCHRLDGAWFRSQEDCQLFIDTEILNGGSVDAGR